MIKTLSPYYLTIPFVSPLTSETCLKYTLNIYVWDGLKTAIPTTPVYSVTKNNSTTSTGNDKVNISRLLNDYIDFSPTVATSTSLIDANNQRWCLTSVVYTTANNTDTDVEQLENLQLFLKGYSYGMDGENVGLPSNRILLDGSEFKVDRNGVFNLPILIEETVPEELTLIITDVIENATNDYDIIYTTSREITNIIVYARDYGDTIWNNYIVLGSISSPLSLLNFISTFGDYEFRLLTYDALTNTVIYSNIFRLTL